MKKKNIVITIALTVTMLASLGGCKSSNSDSGDDSSNGSLKDANFVFLSQDKEENMRNIKSYPDFATAVKNYESKYNGKITMVYSPYSEKQGKLSAMMAAGNPPDLYQPIDGFPQFAVNGYAQPVDNLINLNDSIWKDVKDAFDATEWKGKHNFIVTGKGPQDVLWYNKTLFENNGLETPYDSYKKGNWNWNTMRDDAIKLTQDTDGDKVIDQWGLSTGPESIISTTGNDLVKIDGKTGTIQNNLKNPDVINGFEFFRDLGAGKYNVNQPDLNGYMTDFAKGKVAMYIGATWADTVWWKDLMKKQQCSFVPAPKYPNGKDYYVGGSASYWMIPKGAKNPKAAALFLTELRKAGMDPKVKKISDDGNTKDRGWGDKEVEMYNELQKLKYTYTFFAGVGAIGNDRWGFWGDLRTGGVPVETEIEKHYNTWNNEIDLVSGKVKLVHKEVTALKGTPKIDGEIDDAWKDAQEITTNEEKTTPDIATAKVKLLYDTDTLYVLAQVSDKKIMSDNKNPYDCDSIEFFVDENKSQGNGYDSNTIQLRVGADGKMTGGGSGWDDGKRASALTSAVKKVDGGYIVEAAYKFKGVKAKSGGSMGFNVSVNDEETTGSKKGTSVWNPDKGSSYNNPSRFGVVKFK